MANSEYGMGLRLSISQFTQLDSALCVALLLVYLLLFSDVHFCFFPSMNDERVNMRLIHSMIQRK